MIIDEARKIFRDSDNIRAFKDDLKQILSEVHLEDGMDFASHLLKMAECDEYFDLPDAAKPKAKFLLGPITGIDQFIFELESRSCSKTEIRKILDRAMGADNKRFLQEFTDKILKLIYRISLNQNSIYALCLLSTRYMSSEHKEFCRYGIVEMLWMTISNFDRQAYEMHKTLYKERQYLLCKSEDLKRASIIGKRLKDDLACFTEGYIQLSKQMLMVNLLANSIPYLEEIYSSLYEKAAHIAERLETGEDINHILNTEVTFAETHPTEYKLRPDMPSLLIKEKEFLKYLPCRDGVHIYGGSLLGSGFIDFTTGVTLPCEIGGIPVTEFSGTYPQKKIEHIEAWCIKRVSLTIQGETDMMCKPPLLYGGMQDTIESMSLTYEAPNMHYGSFEGRKDITTIKFTGTVTDIPDWDYGYFEPAAFKDCINLLKIDGVFKGYRLADCTFENCTSLTSVPKLQVTAIGSRAFFNCSSLISIFMHNGLKGIEKEAFAGCSSLEDLYVPDTCLRIGHSAFANCTSLKSIHLPGGIDSISPHLFEGCTKLVKVYLSDTITSIGDNAFLNCCLLSMPWIPQSIKKIGTMAFYGCKAITEITIPAGIEEIGDNAFGEIPNLIIKGYIGTVAEKYAKENKITFIALTPIEDTSYATME